MASSLEKKIYITDRRYQDRPNSCRPSLRSLPPVFAPSPDDDDDGDDDVAHSCTRFPCYLGMEINAKTQ